MTTLLAHIRIRPDKLETWEAIMEDMVRQTHATEPGVVRYEYWKGEAENSYYCLLSFRDKWAFYHHQMSDHHESHPFGEVLESIRLEYVDPVSTAAPGLVRTEDPPLPEGAPEAMRIAQERFPLTIASWWAGRK
ncbi:MAG: putative quinol monooxygenase [Thermaurantiacus tibetensis]|uniref:putative quinol monooxygenase n=1 Tax=Thermaurantiacus tibetensis TaxID=2759035 RepID=UPI00188EBF53|nr:antibiotic biosynthesis monooxygenase family protein [Thermaurantiacus tibetensis]